MDNPPKEVIAKRSVQKKYKSTPKGEMVVKQWCERNAEHLREYRRLYMQKYRQNKANRERLNEFTRNWYRKQRALNTDKYQAMLEKERIRQRELRARRRKEKEAMNKSKSNVRKAKKGTSRRRA